MTAETTTTNSPALARPPSPRQGRLQLVVALLVFTAGGIYVGMRWHSTFERWLVPSAGSAAPAASEQGNTVPGTAKKQLWTCGMHPQVIQDHPGDCPICHMKLTPLVTGEAAGASNSSPAAPASSAGNGERKIKYWHDPMMNPPYISDRPGKSPMGMDLVPVYEDEAKPAGAAVVIDPAVVQNMGVRTVAAARSALSQRVRATSTVVEPESARTDVNLRVSGWIERLYADKDGMAVRKGDPLFDLYSPDLRLAIEELIAAKKAGTSGASDGGTPLNATGEALVAAAELRLQTLGLSQEQIQQLGGVEHAPATVTFNSPVDGIVVDKANVYKGTSVTSGQLVLRLADRSTMWVDARVPEGSLARVRVGQRASLAVTGLGGGDLAGEVAFIHPNLDEMTRTALVRVVVPNPDGLLRAGMFAIAAIETAPGEQVTVVPREAVIYEGDMVDYAMVATARELGGRRGLRRRRTGADRLGSGSGRDRRRQRAVPAGFREPPSGGHRQVPRPERVRVTGPGSAGHRACRTRSRGRCDSPRRDRRPGRQRVPLDRRASRPGKAGHAARERGRPARRDRCAGREGGGR